MREAPVVRVERDNCGSEAENALRGVNMFLRLTVLLLMTASVASAQASMQSFQGQITGTVTDEEGQLVSGASVCTTVLSGANSATTCPVRTDAAGFFHIDNLKQGMYRLSAVKEEAGYAMIDDPRTGAKVRITSVQPAAHVAIRLRARGGILVAIVKDKSSGNPVANANLQYIALDGRHSGNVGGLNRDLMITVPATVDLVLVVTAPHYRGWVYTDSDDSTRPILRLQPGEHRLLNVELEPMRNEQQR